MIFNKIHDDLCENSVFYRNWHSSPHHHHIHWLIFGSLSLLFFYFFAGDSGIFTIRAQTYQQIVADSNSSASTVPRGTGPHDYFNSLLAHPNFWKAYSLRDPAQLQTRENGGYANCNACPLNITYDPANDPDLRRQDAAKAVIPMGTNSLRNQVRLPILSEDGNTYLITWDAWFGAENAVDISFLPHQKTFQIADAGIWFEIQTRYQNARKSPGSIGEVTVRSYDLPQPPFTDNNPASPQVDQFFIKAETWVRYWAEVEQNANGPDYISLWVADENSGPVQILDRYITNVDTRINQLRDFWLEFNTSSKRGDTAPPLTYYVRNVVMLKNLTDPLSIMQRPLPGPFVGNVNPAPPPPISVPPTVPTNLAASVISSSQIHLSWTASTDDVGVTGYKIYRCSGSSCSATLEVENISGTSFNDTGLSPATVYRYRIRAYDAAGNFSSYTAHVSATTFSVSDNVPPAISITAPANGSIVSGSAVPVIASASDNVGVVGVQFRLDSSNLGQESTSPPYAMSWNTISTSNGSHTLTAIARDAAGNQTTSPTISVTVNNTSTPPPTNAPVISDIRVSVRRGIPTIIWRTDVPAVSKVEYGPTLTYGSNTATSSSLTTNHNIILPKLSPGIYNFRVLSETANIVNLSGNASFIVRDKPPALSLVTASAGSIVLNWSNPSFSGFAGIAILRSSTGFITTYDPAYEIVRTAASSYTDNIVTPGITYYYSLFVFDDQENYSDPVIVSFTAPSSSTPPSGGGGGGSAATSYVYSSVTDIVATSTSPEVETLKRQLMTQIISLLQQLIAALIAQKQADLSIPVSSASLPNQSSSPSSEILTGPFGYGLSGGQVRLLQEVLARDGSYFGLIDGYYGDLTMEAVKKFQTKYGIEPTGVAGPITRERLNSIYLSDY